MAARRMIATDIFRDEWFGELTKFERLLWIGIFAACADDQGRFLDRLALIRADVFPYDDDVELDEIEQALQRFERDGKLIRYASGDGKRLAQIANWWEYQHPQWAQRSKWEPPDGWQDHIRTRYNGRYVEENWPPHQKARAKASKKVQAKPSAERTSRTVHVSEQYPNPYPYQEPVQEPVQEPDTNTHVSSVDATSVITDVIDSSEQSKDSSEPADDMLTFIYLPTNRFAKAREEVPITEMQISEFVELYPAVDVREELRKMRGWLLANPKKRKTKAGMLRFVNNWLAREQDKASGNGGARRFRPPTMEEIYSELKKEWVDKEEPDGGTGLV